LIENVQRNFTKRISSIASLSYPERLAILDLDLLELRMQAPILSYLLYSKVFDHLAPYNITEVITIYTPAALSRSELPYLQKPIYASKRQLSTFLIRNVNARNALPAFLLPSYSLLAFKHFLKQLDLSVFPKGSASH
jgi:hypothetical protein